MKVAVMSAVALAIFAGSALAGGETPALGSPWTYECVKGAKDGPKQGKVEMEIYLGGSTDKTGKELVRECNDKYPNGCEGTCWACYSLHCYDSDGNCQGNTCE